MKKNSGLMALALALFLSGCQGELKVTSVEPSKVGAGEAVMVKVKGGGFAEGSKVWFGALESSQVMFRSKRELVALPSPGLAAGKVDVKVELPSGKSATLAGGLAVESRLSIGEVVPGFMAEGSGPLEVRIKGDGFIPGAKVWFGEAESKAEVKTGNLIAAQVPAQPAGMKDVIVQNPDGSKTTLPAGFQVIGANQPLPFMPFAELADKWGLTSKDGSMRQGLAVTDVNQDGFLDFMVTAQNSVFLYLGTAEGKFQDATATSGIAVKSICYGAYFGDFDHDGRPDLLLTGQPPSIYHNLGQAKFEDVTERVGIDKTKVKAWAGAWVDYDGDGLLDLFLGEPGSDDHLYHNLGGKFEEVFPEVFAKKDVAQKVGNTQPTTFSVAFGDYDNDGWPDLFQGIRGQPSALLHNEKGKGFKNVTEALGFLAKATANPPIFFIDWGVIWADFNNDGFLDLFSASGPQGAKLYANQKGQTFADVSKNLRANTMQSPLCPAAGDFDNDGWQDLAISDNMVGFRLFRNQGDGSFQDVTEEAGIPRLSTGPMGVAWVDINRDGALDLMVVEFMDQNRFFIATPYPGRHFLEVSLEGRKANSQGIGAMVVIQAGNTVMTRQVSGGDGYLVQPSPILHFGLGRKDKVDKLTVRWPGGETQVLDNVTVDRVMTIIQPGERKAVTIPAATAPAVQPGATVKPGATATPKPPEPAVKPQPGATAKPAPGPGK